MSRTPSAVKDQRIGSINETSTGEPKPPMPTAGQLDDMSYTSVNLSRPRAQRRASEGGRWSQEEDAALVNIVSEHGAKNWKLVARLLGQVRTDVQCLHRWSKVLRPDLHKGTWSKYEDDIVRDMVLQHGVGVVKWSAIAAKLPGRIGKQCRERWYNHLDPTINKGDWTANEDVILYEAQRHFGNRWREISKLLIGRTENALKNRWYSCGMRKWLKDRELQRGDGYGLLSADEMRSPDGLKCAVLSFKTALCKWGVELAVDVSVDLMNVMSLHEPEKRKKRKVEKLSTDSSCSESLEKVSPGDACRSQSDREAEISEKLSTIGDLPSFLRPTAIITDASDPNSSRISGRTEEDSQLINVLSLLKQDQPISVPSASSDDSMQPPRPKKQQLKSPVNSAMEMLSARLGVGQDVETPDISEGAPLESLVYYPLLAKNVKRDLLQQLFAILQSTSLTPRNHVLCTPRLAVTPACARSNCTQSTAETNESVTDWQDIVGEDGVDFFEAFFEQQQQKQDEQRQQYAPATSVVQNTKHAVGSEQLASQSASTVDPAEALVLLSQSPRLPSAAKQSEVSTKSSVDAVVEAVVEITLFATHSKNRENAAKVLRKLSEGLRSSGSV